MQIRIKIKQSDIIVCTSCANSLAGILESLYFKGYTCHSCGICAINDNSSKFIFGKSVDYLNHVSMGSKIKL